MVNKRASVLGTLLRGSSVSDESGDSSPLRSSVKISSSPETKKRRVSSSSKSDSNSKGLESKMVNSNKGLKPEEKSRQLSSSVSMSPSKNYAEKREPEPALPSPTPPSSPVEQRKSARRLGSDSEGEDFPAPPAISMSTSTSTLMKKIVECEEGAEASTATEASSIPERQLGAHFHLSQFIFLVLRTKSGRSASLPTKRRPFQPGASTASLSATSSPVKKEHLDVLPTTFRSATSNSTSSVCRMKYKGAN